MKVRSFVSSGDIHNALEEATRQYEQWLEEYGNIYATIHNISVETIVSTQLRYTHIITVTYLVKSEVDWKPKTGEVKASWPEQPNRFYEQMRELGFTPTMHVHTYGERGYCIICGFNEPSRQAEINKAYMNAIDEERDQRKSRAQLQEDINTGYEQEDKDAQELL